MSIPREWWGDVVTADAVERDHLVTDARLGPEPVPFGFMHDEWLRFRAQYQPGDEIRTFTSDADSWLHLAGRSGYVLVRAGEGVASILTRLS